MKSRNKIKALLFIRFHSRYLDDDTQRIQYIRNVVFDFEIIAAIRFCTNVIVSTSGRIDTPHLPTVNNTSGK